MLSVEQIAQNILYEWWYSVAENIFQRVCEITELDDDQKAALMQIALRPNDFQVNVQ